MGTGSSVSIALEDWRSPRSRFRLKRLVLKVTDSNFNIFSVSCYDALEKTARQSPPLERRSLDCCSRSDSQDVQKRAIECDRSP
ncbi:hypothetical protein CKA32_000181 [Geitlerinema sp. FC II]|nr:hypothetical protein CKA32_000181 [Geitlerinema sp. FC II]